jgi:hypothetical protein
LSITFTIDGQPYTVSPLDCDPDIGTRAVRFAKQGGDGAVYDLYLSAYGWQCQCLGFERYGYCKHVQTTQKAAQLFGVPGRVGVTDEQLAEAMAYAPEQPQPTEDEVEAMAWYFGQQ